MADLVRGTDVPATLADYSDAREFLRRDFWFSCAYCTVAEAEAIGIGFEIDHYVAVKRNAALMNVYMNLMWSCEHCNNLKRAHPSPAAQARGWSIFNADLNAWDDHFEMVGSRVQGKTAAIGTYTERVLLLNRAPLREIREKRKRLEAAQLEIARGIRALRGMALDKLPAATRARVLEMQARLEKSADIASQEIVDYMLRELNRSPLLDRDPAEARTIAADRRKFLDSCNAVAPRDSIPPAATPDIKAKRAVARKTGGKRRIRVK